MDRRNFLKSAIAIPAILSCSGFAFKGATNFGWLPGFSKSSKRVYDLGNLKNFGVDKVSCLWKAYEEVRKQEWIAHRQEGPDCVAQATGSGVDILTCCQIALEKKNENYLADSCTIAIYAGGRNLIGNRRKAGMQTWWASEYLKQYGNLLRIIYTPYDLQEYSAERLNYYDRNGIPDSLLEKAKEHPLLNYGAVTTWEEVRDAIAGGHPVVLGTASFGGENDQRDADGFMTPSGSWAHAWLAAGCQDGRRPGVCLINSHGASFGKGPKAFGQPDGSVWIDAKYIDRAVREEPSYALASYKGFIKPTRDYILWHNQ